MTGTWKENISSYHKDCRRKRQSRKHTLKDKVKPLIKKFRYKNIDTDFIYTDFIYSDNNLCCYKNTIYIYGKPLPINWSNQYGFWSTKSRKPAAKMANRIGRAKCKEWIHNADWDTPIKNYALEKSIAWEIW